MAARIFVAGATGAIGRRLLPLLRDAGHAVFGMTRKMVNASALEAAGATPVVVDVFDASALSTALTNIRPDVVLHQLTDLPPGLDPSRMEEATPRNARIRHEGTRNLVDAALASGVARLVAQSISWAYAPGPEPHRESDLLDVNAQGLRAISVGGVAALEKLTLNSPPLEGLVLRYGHLYGPGTGTDGHGVADRVHVDAAAHAALLAMDKGQPGAFNIVEANPHASIEKAQRELGWDPHFRLETA